MWEIPVSSMQSPESGHLLVAAGAKVTGNINVPGDLEVHGEINGVVVARSVMVGPAGRVIGKVKARNIVLEGYMSDDVAVESHIRLCATSKIVGRLHYGTVEIEDGAAISARLQKTGSNK
jgi:cytoskeletal protein CcmA (bactofilin family)